MYQVTAIYEGCEIGYGEGDSSSYAIGECLESIDSIYNHANIIASLNVLSNSNVNTVPLGKIYGHAGNKFIVKRVSTNKQLA
jgi:hypothetical protein